MIRRLVAAAMLSCLLAVSPVASDGVESDAGGPAIPGPSPVDEEMERFLAEGEIVSLEEIGTGITRPKKAVLRYEGRTAKAALKDVDVFRGGRTAFESGRREVNFTDNYRYERAAYLFDRRLGLGMVPVAVLRKVNGSQGAMIEWVADAITEEKRRAEDTKPDPPYLLSYQRSLMHLFDALIYNIDRNLGNQLYTLVDWKLHLIDHTRAFRTDRDLPPDFLTAPIRLPRRLVPVLESLDQQELRDLFEGLLSKAQVKALLARRDEILKKLERDRERYGEVMVFVREPEEALAQPSAAE